MVLAWIIARAILLCKQTYTSYSYVSLMVFYLSYNKLYKQLLTFLCGYAIQAAKALILYESSVTQLDKIQPFLLLIKFYAFLKILVFSYCLLLIP